MEIINLTLINNGETPTCVRKQGNSIIDLTWATPQIANRIENWKVEGNETSLSDHNYITFSVSLGKHIGKLCVAANAYPRWKFDTMDEEMFEETIEWNCSNYNINETEIIEDAAWIRKTMTEAADMSMNKVKNNTKR